MTGYSKNRRRQLVVDKEAQGRLILQIALFPSLALSVTCVLITVFCQRLYEEAVAANVELPSLVPLLITMFGFVAVSGVFIMWNATKLSHKVAGPAYNLERCLRRIREGETHFQVRLRKGDQLSNLADELNAVLEWLREHPPAGVEKRKAAPEAAEATPVAAATAPSDDGA